MSTQTHYKKLINPDYLGAYSLTPGMDMIVTIERVVVEEVTGTDGKTENCTVAHLKGCKPMILNVTNCKTIAAIYSTPYIEEWEGKQITLYAASVRAFGEVVEALRVRPVQPTASGLEELTPKHPKWAAAQKALAAGSVTIEQIKSKYSLTSTNIKSLCNNSK